MKAICGSLVISVMLTAALFAVDKFVTPDKLPSVNQQLEPIPDAGVPSPIAASGCKPGCGCNRPGCNCGEVIAAAGCQANVQWNLPAVSVFREAQPADVIEMYAPVWCSACPQWQALLGDGDGQTRLKWIKAECPLAIKSPVYPLAYHRKSNTYTPGDKLPKTMDGIREKFGLKPKPSTHLSAISAGTIDRKWVEPIAKLLGESGSVQLGNAAYQDKFGIASVSVPAQFHAAWSTSGGKTTAKFSNQPLIKLAVIEQKLDGVSWDGKSLTLMIPWMPDLVLEAK